MDATILHMARTVEGVARSLVARFPEDDTGNFDEIWSTAEASGVDPDRVLERMQDLYSQARQRAGITERWIDPARLQVLDLRHLESTRTRIKASGSQVTDDERSKYGGTEYLLVREPQNEHDAQAIAIYGKGRCVGYVSASAAARLSPELDQLHADAFLVSGASTVGGSIRLWVDLPRVPNLRRFVREVV